MKVINRKIRIGFITLTCISLVTTAAVLGGIEWAFAALGAFVLIGMCGVFSHILFKVFRYSRLPLKDESLESIYFPRKTAQERPVNIWDKRRILRHIDEVFTMDGEESTGTSPLTNKDKKIIMRNIDEMFSTGQDQELNRPEKSVPITLEDKKMIMRNIEELFVIDTEHSEEISW
jgi:hypothetical protein